MGGETNDETNGTRRFREKRDAILAAAADAINEQSAKGMTFADVARRVGLNTTSITYYFRRKDDLTAAVLDQSLDALMAMLADAATAPTPETRVERLLTHNMTRLAAIARGEQRPLAMLSDLRAMDEPIRARLLERWRTVFRRARALWGDTATPLARALAGARAHVLLENVFWLPVWLPRYDTDQYDRVAGRLLDLFRHGLAMPGAQWAPRLAPTPPTDALQGREAFLQAATHLINELGYRGASVQRIAAQLNVTKGSFYHHLDAKDDLVAACSRRSFDTIATAQRVADQRGGPYWQRLCDIAGTLVAVQFSDHGALLRSTALTGLPAPVRTQMVDRSTRIALRFAGSIMDGAAEGSIRPVDGLIASEAMMALVNAAFDMRGWARALAPDLAVRLYASTLMFGMFDDRALDPHTLPTA